MTDPEQFKLFYFKLRTRIRDGDSGPGAREGREPHGLYARRFADGSSTVPGCGVYASSWRR